MTVHAPGTAAQKVCTRPSGSIVTLSECANTTPEVPIVVTSRECAEITERVGRQRLIEITANPALTGFTAGKIL